MTDYFQCSIVARQQTLNVRMSLDTFATRSTTRQDQHPIFEDAAYFRKLEPSCSST